MSIYSRKYLDRYDVYDKTFYTRKNPDAKQHRDKLARKLRRDGWTVETSKAEFPDMGTGTVYTIHATREKEPGEWSFLR